MSMNRLAIVAAIGTHNSMKNRTDDIRLNKHPSIEKQERPSGPSGAAFNGDVNILLGGAMLSIVISIVCFVCYCCHRSLKHRDVVYRQRWLQVDPNMDIYSVEQYYDITANNGMNDDHYTQVMKNHGPPPSYEIAVAMKTPIELEKCHLCQNKIRLSCSCDSNIMKGDEHDIMIQKSDQFLNVKNISHRDSLYCCDSESDCKNQQCMSKTCPMCDEEVNCKNNNITDEDIQNGNSGDGYCRCSNYKYISNTGLLGTNDDNERVNNPGTTCGHDINANVPSTSGDVNCMQNGDLNSNYEESDDDIDNEDNEFDSLNENGLIRVDMTKIIDQTGLPTYEAALKLEATGYV